MRYVTPRYAFAAIFFATRAAMLCLRNAHDAPSDIVAACRYGHALFAATVIRAADTYATSASHAACRHAATLLPLPLHASALPPLRRYFALLMLLLLIRLPIRYCFFAVFRLLYCIAYDADIDIIYCITLLCYAETLPFTPCRYAMLDCRRRFMPVDAITLIFSLRRQRYAMP